ncbi:hypothetical protein FACS1894216_11290 [Synergistales bacterium]|nr:hypothetical protein FACS1894216_11290 [Synergistales bacterium]
MIGVVVIEPPGIEMTYVFDVANGRKILFSTAIHGKDERIARMSESMRILAHNF